MNSATTDPRGRTTVAELEARIKAAEQQARELERRLKQAEQAKREERR